MNWVDSPGVLLRTIGCVACALALVAAAPPDAPRWVLPPTGDPHLTRWVIESAAVGGPVSVDVALPDAAATDPGRCFPLLVWLHGTGGGSSGASMVAAAVRRATAAGAIPPVVVAFPNGLTHHLWTDSADGRTPVERVLLDEVLPYVDAHAPTLPVRDARWLAGFSMGGYGTARLALRHPDRFGAALALAPGPLDEGFDGPRAQSSPALRAAILRDVHADDLAAFSAQSPLRLAREAAPGVVASLPWLVATGDADPMAPGARSLTAALQAGGGSVRHLEAAGVSHEPARLIAAIDEDLWAWVRDRAAAIPTNPEGQFAGCPQR
jgi:S-formylglutathione hydrolase FrmB